MFNMDKLCRLCLTEEDVATRLFDDSHENKDFPLYERVMQCIPVKVQWGDGLPTFLCKACTNNVNSFWRFSVHTRHVDSSLRELLKEGVTSASNEWEEKIKAIAADANAKSASTILERKIELHSPCKVPLTNDRVKDELVIGDETDEEDWPDSPETPPVPSYPACPRTTDMDCDEDHSQASPQKTKQRGGRRTEYSCKFCRKKFPRASTVAQHELTHLAVKPFSCEDCDKSFWYRGSLIGHVKQTHTGEVNYKCDMCGKKFFKKTELTRHKPTHSNETPHKCPECGLGFKIPKTLKRHIRNVHNSQRSHTCDTCGKSFVQLQTLKVHMLLHTGEKPHVCSYCGKAFAQSAPLKTHIRTHTGERPFSCHICNDTFANRTSLIAHAFKHDDTLPYPCTRCSSSFRLKRELVQHEQGHVDEERQERSDSDEIEVTVSQPTIPTLDASKE